MASDDAEPLLGRPATGDSSHSHPTSLSHFFRSLQGSLFPSSEPTSPADSRRSSNTSSQAPSDKSEGFETPRAMAVWDAQEFIREFIDDAWSHHSASIAIDCSLPLDELLTIGLLPEAEGFRACRRLVRVPVIHEEVSLALWQKLAETAGRSPAQRATENEDNNSSSSNTNPADSPTDGPSQSQSRRRSALSLSSLTLALKRKSSENGLLLWSAAQRRLHKKHQRQPPQPPCAFCRCNCPANWAATPETAATRRTTWRRKSSNSSSSSSNNQDSNNNNNDNNKEEQQFWQRGEPRPPPRRPLCRCHTGDGGHYRSSLSAVEGGCEHAEHLQAGGTGVGGAGSRVLGRRLWAGIASAGESIVSCVGVCCGAGVGAESSVPSLR